MFYHSYHDLSIQPVHAPNEPNNEMKKNHSSADDTQLYLALSPNDYSPIDSLCQCIDEVNNWMCQNFLQLNKDKIEVIAFETKMKFSMWMHTFTVGV